MVLAISENHFKQIKTALSNIYFYLDEVAQSNQEAVEHLAEVEEALSTLQSVKVGSRGCQLIVEGITTIFWRQLGCMKLLMLDLDTVRKPKSGGKFIGHPQDQQIIEGADKAIAHYHREGYIIVGISNQGRVAAGHKNFSDCFLEQRYTLNLFPQISEICFCPDFEGL